MLWFDDSVWGKFSHRANGLMLACFWVDGLIRKPHALLHGETQRTADEQKVKKE